MSKYHWNFEKIKKEGRLVRNIPSQNWTGIWIRENKEIFLGEASYKSSENISVNDNSVIFSRVRNRDYLKAIFIPLKVFQISYGNIMFEEAIRLDVDGFEQLNKYVKTPMPSIKINEKNIGDIKFNDNAGVIKSVKNVVFKDISGEVKNLK